MSKVFIEIVRRGDDCGKIVQFAFEREQAQYLIDNVLPKPEHGYFYKIV